MKKYSLLMVVMAFLISGSVFPGFIKRRVQVDQFRKVAEFKNTANNCSAKLYQTRDSIYFLECAMCERWCENDQVREWFDAYGKNSVLVREAKLYNLLPEWMDKTSLKNIKANMLKQLQNSQVVFVEQFTTLSIIKVRVKGYLYCSKSKDACYKKFAEIFGQDALIQLKEVN